MYKKMKLLEVSPPRQLMAYVTLILTFLLFVIWISHIGGWIASVGAVIGVTWAWRISELSYTGVAIILCLIGVLGPIVVLQIVIWNSSLHISWYEFMSDNHFASYLGWFVLSVVVSISWLWVLRFLTQKLNI
ncbi:MAG: hypothetical protein DRR19_04675 [Candidatus Parabeggiatoa sp. nov. 1]|nr:MAG: hypothetical protein DRR19_04675 [Gammaproteobacteria bacterium]